MKKRILITLGVFCSLNAISQQAPTPTPPSDPTSSLPNTQKGAYAWYRGGNSNAFNPAGSSNLFGTLWNSPIYTQTFGINRMKLNGSLNYNVNGYTGIRDGYLLLGYSATYSNDLFSQANQGAYSLFHLNGGDGSFVQSGGYRPWI